MQTEQSKQDAVKKINDRQREELHTTIEDFYHMGGLSSPIDTLLDSVQQLFNGIDGNSDPGEDGKPQRLYQMYSPDALSDQIFGTFLVIRFLIELNEKFEMSPDNPKIKRNSIS
ncbi:MAG: hypothetical protein H7096_12820 [Flavobacterium sp.]|nr:hypothetical protein [Pedobacter sp.]